ncbi:ribonuclease Z [Alkalispirochaeta americana]|uniref:Ribonuclease Z n=2 Tax=Alkalispirochaeta americana TaxID=159291 RepID=A0A1N6VL53_9SPIO|nr:ribonuclease Z [Alkalispirochaeta americana]
MEAFILGCGGMMPLPNRHLTSVLLRREGEVFLFDCGEGTQVSLRALNLKWKKISAIFISHTHADHITGLPGMLMLSSQVDRQDPLFLIGPPRLAEYVEANRRALEMHINYEIRVQEIQDPSLPQDVFFGEGYRVRAFPLKHSRVCVGYSFIEDVRPGVFHPERAEAAQVPRGALWAQLQRGEAVQNAVGEVVTADMVLGPPRRGRKFTFMTDTLPVASAMPHIAGSDLLISEGMFDEANRESAMAKKHMTAADAARLARGAGGIKQMGLIHYSPRFTYGELKVLQREAREIFPETFLTRDHMTIKIPQDDGVLDDSKVSDSSASRDVPDSQDL